MTKTCYTHLSPEERATLSLGLAQGHSLRMMDSVEAKTILLHESMKYRAKSYDDLKCLLGRQDTYEISGSSGMSTNSKFRQSGMTNPMIFCVS